MLAIFNLKYLNSNLQRKKKYSVINIDLFKCFEANYRHTLEFFLTNNELQQQIYQK